ncbi:TonB-dependent receptor domain-containing protein [Sphingomonas pseudosanguinis]|uniref:Outer membrane receptor protein involved in Fe transport n=1 Tax=Sphingomonas pseudosanguinis TaxID=413712 RepID=A0A7W6AAF4_9SPHN|nr:TonB-dependent receptor [Sphingomonas pseudosanguinis]MBB3879065.1 outer membrane receptor protein involved in Fe transport [Sphingomonas pseudosanguinis]MBN3537215.1 TonB-dependent receptor [Sphingomonas pseudosanguinis]
MFVHSLLATVASLGFVPPAIVEDVAAKDAAPQAPVASRDTISTGVAKGRDRLDSATSTSILHPEEIETFGPRSTGDLLRIIPGIRSEASTGEGGVSLSVRGLPIASQGLKFVQLQEDGLPVLEFGDILAAGPDLYLRTDLNIAQVEVIRGGSASTFASNSPGGLINFVSKTGTQEGGAVALTAGLDYRQYRADFDYGAKLGDGLRFHVGGFYRQGDGPRRTGYDAQKGGQIKLNVTKEFAGGYIRLYGKYLDDRTPFYDAVPYRATGTNADPQVRPVVGFDGIHDTMMSRYIRNSLVLDGNNNIAAHAVDGLRSKATTIGLETQIDLSGWTVTERFRYAKMSGAFIAPFSSAFLPTSALPLIGGAGATLSYANGPLAGQAIANPATLNGNGLFAIVNLLDLQNNNLDNVTNDIRASRVWNVGGGELTTTAGFYAARQTIARDALWSTLIADVRGDGRTALLDIRDRTGRLLTLNGIYAFNLALANGTRRRSIDVDYAVNAPFASVNYHIGRVAIGASVRYDFGSANGRMISADLGGGRIGTVARDMNGDGVISPAEQKVGVSPLTAPAPVDYDYHYLSYSTGINFRIADPLAVFARYSRGARANADRLLFTPAVSNTTGALLMPSAAYDPVKQAEVGVKYRTDLLTLNLTGFWAKSQDSNVDPVTSQFISRDYEAKGLEFEGGLRRGVFGLTAGATYTHARIVKDRVNPAFEGNTPRHQAAFIFQATPQLMIEDFTIGATFVGTTDSYAQDNNLLKVPGFVTTNGFVQAQVADRMTLLFNVNNLFDVAAFTGFDESSIPASGIVRGRPLNGRTVSATVRFDF